MSGNRVEYGFDKRLSGPRAIHGRQVRYVEWIDPDFQCRAFALRSTFALVVVVHAIEVQRSWTRAVDIVIQDTGDSPQDLAFGERRGLITFFAADMF
jgi:hypothetical protein